MRGGASRLSLPDSLLILTALAANLALVASYSPDLAVNDAAEYMSEARNILAGRGLTTDIAYYDEHHRLGRFPVPQTVFPPGYPLSIAAFSAVGLPIPTAAFVVCLLSFNLSVALAYALVRAVSDASSLAALAGTVLAGSVVAVARTLAVAPEMPFVAATLVAAVGLQRMSRGGPWAPLMAGLATAAVVSVRYAGLFFLAALALVMLARLARLRNRCALRDLALALAPGAITAVALLARNSLLVGDFKGGNAFELSHPVTEVLRQFAWSVQGLVGFSRSGLEAGRLPELMLVAAVVGLTALAFAARPEWGGGLAHRLLHDESASLAVAYVGVSLIALWQLERTRTLDLSSRMLLPLLPFALVLGAAAVPAVRWRRPRLTVGALAALLAIAYLIGQTSLPTPEQPSRHLANRRLRLALEHSEPVVRLLSEDAARRRPYLTSQPHLMGRLFAQPVVGLTSAQYTGTHWTCEATERLARRYGVRHVVFFRQAFLEQEAESPRETSNQECLRHLARGQVPSWLEIIQAGADPQLFELRE